MNRSRSCNLRRKDQCPLEGNFQAKSIVYRATVNNDEGTKHYDYWPYRKKLVVVKNVDMRPVGKGGTSLWRPAITCKKLQTLVLVNSDANPTPNQFQSHSRRRSHTQCQAIGCSCIEMLLPTPFQTCGCWGY